MDPLAEALELIYRGDVAGLAAAVRAAPALVHARADGREPPYDGYFHRATLLHHVAGNPHVRPLPPAIVAIAEVLLDAGAEVDAVTEAGPTQPHDIGWTPLGLVASSAEARRAGTQEALLARLHARGADLDARAGGVLMGALYYGETAAAAWLAAHGARVDLIAAAGLGRIDLMARFVGDDGALADDAHTLVHYSLVRDRPRGRDQLLALALAYAALSGVPDAVAWLLDRGADVQARPPFDHHATALHWAAHRGHAAVVQLLLARGADPLARDRTFDGVPRDWAYHGGHPALMDALPPAP